MEFTGDEEGTHKFRKLILFSGNDYLGLSSHPTIGKAASKAALEHGMGPRGSALICGYTDYHRQLESCIADLKKKEVLNFLSSCTMRKKVVVTDRQVPLFLNYFLLFSMDGDFASMIELVKLRKVHGFLLVIDEGEA
ncbi:unnamed protein product [Prunus armeniaca]